MPIIPSRRSPYLQVTTATATREDAERIARACVAQRFAACAQVLGPIHSVYWWQGAQEEADEWLCLLKTTRDAWQALETAIRGMHPYENPEVVATDIAAGAAAYLAWIASEVRPQPG